LEAKTANRTLALLDEREKGGYTRQHHRLLCLHSRQEFASGWVYFALPENPNYLGDASAITIADQARRASGPSGANKEYVLKLADSLHSIGIQDDHVAEIADLLRTSG